MDKIFKLKEHHTDVKTEILAGLTTFMTMAYVLAVQPGAIVGAEAAITDCNGDVISKSAILVMCALVSGLVTILMAFYANMPFALSTGMGTNFLLGAMIQGGTMSFGSAMVITLISGVEAGGRTGLTALTTGIMLLLTIFAAPLFMVIPYAATGPALIFVGFLMIGGLTEIDFSDFTEAFGPFMMIVFGAFTANIAASIGAGIIAHIIKVFTGKAKEIHPGLYILCIPMVLYFIYN